MSFLISSTARRAAIIPRAAIVATPRAFTTTPISQKTATEAAKDGLKKVDRTVSDNIILPGLDAAASAKEKVAGTAEKVAGQTEGKAAELKGEAKGAAAEAQGKAAELKGQAKGVAKGAAEQVKQKL